MQNVILNYVTGDKEPIDILEIEYIESPDYRGFSIVHFKNGTEGAITNYDEITNKILI